MAPKKSAGLTQAELKASVAALPETEVRKHLLEAAMKHPDVAQKLKATQGRPPKEPDWDDFSSSLPQYYSAIPAQTPAMQLKMLERILQEVVLNEDSAFYGQLERMAGDQRFSAFFSPWYVRSYPPRQKSKMAMIAGCEDADELPKIIVKRLLKIVKAHPSCSTPNEWQAFAGRAAEYQETRADHPFYIDADDDEPWEQLISAIGRAANGGKPVLKRPSAASSEASAPKKSKR